MERGGTGDEAASPLSLVIRQRARGPLTAERDRAEGGRREAAGGWKAPDLPAGGWEQADKRVPAANDASHAAASCTSANWSQYRLELEAPRGDRNVCTRVCVCGRLGKQDAAAPSNSQTHKGANCLLTKPGRSGGATSEISLLPQAESDSATAKRPRRRERMKEYSQEGRESGPAGKPWI